jgi:3-hydroxyisobutyrate dehydrogenase
MLKTGQNQVKGILPVTVNSAVGNQTRSGNVSGQGKAIGFIGIGNMGGFMAANLVKAGHSVTVADANADAVKAFVNANAGAKAADSLSALAASSEIVITMLPQIDVVKAVLFGDGGDCLMDGLSEGKMLVDMSSSDPMKTRDLQADLAGRGIKFVDAPVSGGIKGAEAGTLAIMAGGTDEQIAEVEPVLQAMGANIYNCGGPGAGQATKALNNLVNAVGMVITVETMLMGKEFGLEMDTFIDVLNASTGRNGTTERKAKQFFLTHVFNSGFSMDLMVKDITTAMRIAEGTNLPTDLLTHGVNRWLEAQKDLGPGHDHCEISAWMEKISGRTL